jgi:hypothetical protein
MNELINEWIIYLWSSHNGKGNQIVWDKKSSHNLATNYLQLSCN